MLISDIILMVKERLRDEKNENWAESSLLDLVRIAYKEVSKELQIYQKSILYTHDGSVKPLPLPRDLLQLIAVFLNDVKLDIKSYEFSMRHRDESTYPIAIINYDGLRITPTPQAGSIVEAVYKFVQPIYSADVEVDLPELAHNALLFYTLYMANQKETRKDSLEKSNYYLGMYSAEITKVKKDFLGFKNSRNIYPQYVKV